MSFHGYFTSVAESLIQSLHPDERLIVNYRGEDTDYIRWNRGQVRQNTSVLQKHIQFEYFKKGRRLRHGFSATGRADQDKIEGLRLLNQARQQIQVLPEDPFQPKTALPEVSHTHGVGQLLPAEELISAIARPSRGLDLTGIYMGGRVDVGLQSSEGQQHWFSTENSVFDYSLFRGDRAVKSCYAGLQWRQSDFESQLEESRQLLEVMDRPRKSIKPGKYRVYLAPSAVAELTALFNFTYGAFSLRAYKNGLCAFKKLKDHERQLSPHLSLSENFNLGFTPRFNNLGELAAEHLPIVKEGRLENLLVSSRSAQEYSDFSNFAAESESLRALEIHPGVLKKDQILAELGTGLYLSNLHYTNWSDRENARVTGMTRYACLWVENGKIIAPMEDLRFDVSMYDIFGDHLLAVTDFQEVQSPTDAFESRSLGGSKLPGMLIRDYEFTL